MTRKKKLKNNSGIKTKWFLWEKSYVIYYKIFIKSNNNGYSIQPSEYIALKAWISSSYGERKTNLDEERLYHFSLKLYRYKKD